MSIRLWFTRGWRVVCWPFMAFFELLLLLVGWAVVFRWPGVAARISGWAEASLPGPQWYWPNDTTAFNENITSTKL